MQIIGILLVRNEDLHVERAIRNVIDFCDRLIAVENDSRDGTKAILEKLKSEFSEKIELYHVGYPGISHDLIKGYAGTDTWIFGVDGDEIYDPDGLARMRVRLKEGEFDREWCLFGNVLNVRKLDAVGCSAEGHLAPPCRSMTKLYNFHAISAWEGPCHERLHGGRVIYREGFHEKLRRNLHEEVSWEESDFRCLHLCFLRRSSVEADASKPRKNIMDRYAWSITKVLKSAVDFVLRKPPIDWKEQRYGRGPVVSKPTASFFPSCQKS
jgi:glycosyltransferase involved in cell wall biosynthesis